MACAGYTRSVAYSRGGVNPRRPEKSQSRARCAARTAVCSDPRYSPGAARVYVLMDDWAGWGGRAYPRHKTLAAQMGRSRQSIQRYVAELERGGAIVRIERAGRAVVYVLRWASEAHGRASALVNNPVGIQPECAPRTEPAPAPPVEEPLSSDNGSLSEPCARCGGTGERVYHVNPGRDSLGRATPGRTWRGKCGCEPLDGDLQRSVQTVLTKRE